MTKENTEVPSEKQESNSFWLSKSRFPVNRSKDILRLTQWSSLSHQGKTPPRDLDLHPSLEMEWLLFWNVLFVTDLGTVTGIFVGIDMNIYTYSYVYIYSLYLLQ